MKKRGCTELHSKLKRQDLNSDSQNAEPLLFTSTQRPQRNCLSHHKPLRDFVSLSTRLQTLTALAFPSIAQQVPTSRKCWGKGRGGRGVCEEGGARMNLSLLLPRHGCLLFVPPNLLFTLSHSALCPQKTNLQGSHQRAPLPIFC